MSQDSNIIFDREFALNQLSGNADLLQKMLDRFSSDYAGMGDELEPIIAQNDHEECRKKAHTIKGVAGNLGFWNLHHHSKILEEAAKDKVPMADVFEEFKRSLTASFDAIKTGSDETPTPAPSMASSKDPKEELSELLNAFEFIDPGKLEQLLDDAGVAEDIKGQIIQAINDLDYPNAIELLENS